MSFNALLSEDQRYMILRLLSEDADYAHNEAILRRALDMAGHQLSQDKLRTELAWLAEQDLIIIETVGNGLKVAKLTTRGLDVAQARTIVPGVARPIPGL